MHRTLCLGSILYFGTLFSMISVTLLLKSVRLAFGPVLIFRPRRCSLCPDGRRESEMNLHFKGCVTHRVDSLRVQTPPMVQARGLRTTCKVRIQHTRGRVRTWWPHSQPRARLCPLVSRGLFTGNRSQWPGFQIFFGDCNILCNKRNSDYL